MTSPTFCARLADGVETRMTVWQDAERETLDLARGVKLARHAYRSRTKQEPVPIVAARFERKVETLQEYNAAQLAEAAA
jgi:hypothetical protein